MVTKEKLEILNKIRDASIDPYPYSFKQTRHAVEIISSFLNLENKQVSVAGRIMKIRRMGGVSFADLLDGSGKIQILFRSDMLSAEAQKNFRFIDIGDIIGVTGNVIRTKKGEISVEAKETQLLAKCLRGLPDKFHGVEDVELRYRKRYLDLMVNPEVRKNFFTRAALIKHVRDTLDAMGYLEAETPVLQSVYGGAAAKPFITHHEALGSDMYLRISCELYLKRLIIGGIERVYEVSKDFRNEDIDSIHNPEFTQIEFYEAYGDYNTYMNLVENMISTIVEKIFGSLKFEYQGKSLDFTPPFERRDWVKELKEQYNLDVLNLNDEQAKTLSIQEKLDIKVPNAYHVADALFDKYIKPTLFQPAYVVDFPAYMCPLTKDKRGNSKLSERFEFFVAYTEMGNCYSELTDPVEQRKKFAEQEAERKKGDHEAPPSDEDFLEAIEYGMPPTVGMGLSIDRLSMILSNNTSIKEMITFPSMKPLSDINSQ